MNRLNDLPSLLIPSYQPEEKLIGLVQELLKTPWPVILIVNDGSSPEKAPIFQALEKLERVIVLHHPINQGKGQALKTGFQYFLDQGLALGVVTVDADGQHLPPDILNVARALQENPEYLILGCRAFDKNVPLRSSFGNHLTRYVFGLIMGKIISDTQTGLRGIPKRFMGPLLQLKTGRYEFELDMLMKASSTGVPIQEVPITTVYENNNESSHFNPIKDSLRIYFVFFRFLFSSILTAGLDFIVFAFVFRLTENILTSMCVSRIVAATFNFVCVRLMVFKHKGSILKAAAKFALLVLSLGALSYWLIDVSVTKLGMGVMVAKVLVETLLFLLNFTVQRLYIFNRERRKRQKELEKMKAQGTLIS